MNPKELEILQTILRSAHPIGLPDILNQNPTLVKSTVAAALAKLLNNGMIEVGGIGRSGKVICRTYVATSRARDFLLNNITNSYEPLSDVIPSPNLCLSLLRTNKDASKARAELAQLRAMLDDYEKELDLMRD